MIEDWELEDPEILDNDGQPILEVGQRSQPIAGVERGDEFDFSEDELIEQAADKSLEPEPERDLDDEVSESEYSYE